MRLCLLDMRRSVIPRPTQSKHRVNKRRRTRKRKNPRFLQLKNFTSDPKNTKNRKHLYKLLIQRQLQDL
jgi:hypothetical protein